MAGSWLDFKVFSAAASSSSEIARRRPISSQCGGFLACSYWRRQSRRRAPILLLALGRAAGRFALALLPAWLACAAGAGAYFAPTASAGFSLPSRPTTPRWAPTLAYFAAQLHGRASLIRRGGILLGRAMGFADASVSSLSASCRDDEQAAPAPWPCRLLGAAPRRRRSARKLRRQCDKAVSAIIRDAQQGSRRSYLAPILISTEPATPGRDAARSFRACSFPSQLGVSCFTVIKH